MGFFSSFSFKAGANGQTKKVPSAMKGERVKEPAVVLATETMEKCKAAGKADFDRVVAASRATGDKFTDSTFPATNSCVYLDDAKPHPDISLPHTFKRLSEICDEPQLFVDGVSSGDIQQGGIGTCYLLGALSVVAAYKEHTEDLFIGYDSEAGVACVRFFKEGRWVYTVIDDYVGVNEDGSFWGAHCADKNEVWVPLMEKAYAALHGNYESVNGGFVSQALVDLTGGSGEMRSLEELGSEDAAFYYLDGVLKKGLLASCFINGGQEVDAGCGLFSGHAYGILRVVATSHGHKLIQIRNPWGKSEWNGDWSDESNMWDEELLAETGHKLEDDGTFWMSAEDFVAQWTFVDVCRVFTNPWVTSSVFGTFTSSDTQQTHYMLKAATEGGRIGRTVIVLSQADQRLVKNGDYEVTIGFFIYRCLNEEYDPASRSWGMTYKRGQQGATREVFLEMDLDPRYTYVIQVATGDADEDGNQDGAGQPYSMRVYASMPIKLEDTGAPEFEAAFEVGAKVAAQFTVCGKRFKGLMTKYGELVAVRPSAPHYMIQFEDEEGCELVDAEWVKEHNKLYNLLEATEGEEAAPMAA